MLSLSFSWLVVASLLIVALLLVTMTAAKGEYFSSTFQDDIDYLHKLYDATNGTNWEWETPVTNTSAIWNFTINPVNPCGGWQGVNCVAAEIDSLEGRVYELILNGYNLAGKIPRGISALSKLSEVVLAQNNLVGTIPHEFCYMSNLTYLDLELNQMFGTIPSCFFQNKTSQLDYLSLASNAFHGRLPNATRPLNMTFLSVQNNVLSGSIPQSWTNNFKKLQTLYLSQNGFYGCIDVITHLSDIKYLGISQNYFSGTLPDDLSMITSLRSLYIHENDFVGTLPKSWENLVNLYYFSSFENRLTGRLPSNYSEWKKIVVFTVDDNHFTGPLPESYGTMQEMQQFTVYNNYFSGTLSSAFSKLRKLQLLLVQENKFVGNLDKVFNSTIQKYLETVDFSMNAFTGILPTEVFTDSLLSFSAFQTCFEGTIPDTICNAPNLQTLVLDGITSFCASNIWQSIPGSPQYSTPVKNGVPDCIWLLPNISTLHVSSNDLSGTIPALSSYGNLTDLDLSFNRFVGTIPMELQTWTKLLNLNLKNNRFVGEIEGMNSLHYTRSATQPGISLSLSNNRLSGIIPMAILHALYIDIVDGNLFTCSSKHQPPYSDPNSANYVCASNMLDISLFCFLAAGIVVFFCLCLAIIVLRNNGFRVSSYADEENAVLKPATKVGNEAVSTSIASPWSLLWSIYQHCRDTSHLFTMWQELNGLELAQEAKLPRLDRWFRQFARTVISVLYWHQIIAETRDAEHIDQIYLTQFLKSVQVLRRIVVVIGLFIAIVTIPVFDVLKLYYGTYFNQYRWLISGAFFSGYQPAIAVLLIWIVVLVFTIYLIDRDIPSVMTAQLHPSVQRHLLGSFSWSFSNPSGGNSRQESNSTVNEDDPSPPQSIFASITASSLMTLFQSSAGTTAASKQKEFSSSGNRASAVDSGSYHPSNDWGANLSGQDSNNSSKQSRSALRQTIFRATQTLTVTVKSGADYWRRPSVWISIIALFINIVVVLAIKTGFIYLLISSRTTFSFKVLIEMGLAAVDLTWSAILIPIIVNRLPKKRATGRMLLKTSMLYFNSIFAPCIVIAAVDSSCFNGIFVKAAQVEEQFLINYCFLLNPDNPLQCADYQTFTSTRYYTPLFIYNFDCYSTIITNYIPIFLISYTTLTLFVPLVSMIVMTSKEPWSVFQMLPAIYKANSKHCEDPWLSTATIRDTCDDESNRGSRQSDVYSTNNIIFSNQTPFGGDSTSALKSVVTNQLHVQSQQKEHEGMLTEKEEVDDDDDDDDNFSMPSVAVTPSVAGVSGIAGSLAASAPSSTPLIPFPFRSKSVFFPAFILASAVHHLLVLITFGLLCPALAVSVMVVVCATTMTWEVVIGRWLTLGQVLPPTKLSKYTVPISVDKENSVHVDEDRLLQLDSVCENVCTSPRKCIWLICFGSAFFFAFVLLDMAGDTQGWYEALWAPIAVMATATAFWLGYLVRTNVCPTKNRRAVPSAVYAGKMDGRSNIHSNPTNSNGSGNSHGILKQVKTHNPLMTEPKASNLTTTSSNNNSNSNNAARPEPNNHDEAEENGSSNAERPDDFRVRFLSNASRLFSANTTSYSNNPSISVRGSNTSTIELSAGSNLRNSHSK